MIRYIVAEAFINSNNIIKYSYISYFVRNVIFYLSLFLILIKLKPFFKFNFINYLAFRRRFFISFNKSNKYLFFYVNAFIFL